MQKSLLFGLSLIAFLTVSFRARALEPIQFTGTPSTSKEANQPLYPTAQIKPATTKAAISLNLTGDGVRKKTIFQVSVYHLASYAEGLTGLQCSTAMATLDKSKAKVLHFTFLRTVSSEQIRDSFKESLKEYGMDVEKGPTSEALKQFTFNLPEKSNMDLVGKEDNEGNQLLEVKAGENEFSVKGPKIVSDFWQIWFGTKGDGQMKDLRKKLCGEKNS